MFQVFFGYKGQSGWGPKQADLAGASPACGGGIGTKSSLRFLPIQTILGFYKQMTIIALSLCERWTAAFFPNTENKYLLKILPLSCHFTNYIILQGFILFIIFQTLLYLFLF